MQENNKKILEISEFKNVIVILSRCHRNRFLRGKDRKWEELQMYYIIIILYIIL